MKFREITKSDELLDLISWHNQNSKIVALDTETTGLNTFQDKVTMVIMSDRDPMNAVHFAPSMAPMLSSLKTRQIWQNFKFDWLILFRNLDVDLRFSDFRDTMLMHHLVDENADHDLDSMVQGRYGDKYKEVFWNKYKTFEEAPKAEQVEYACKDVVYTHLLYRDLESELADQGIPDSLVAHVHDLARELYQTELDGLTVDPEYIVQLGAELRPKIDEYTTKMRELVKGPVSVLEMETYLSELENRKTLKGKQGVEFPRFNFNSSAQLCELLYHRLKVPERRNKAKNLSVDDAALESNALAHPIIPMIQEYRTYQKAYTAFVEGTLDRMLGGRIYPSFNINGTVTGRISSSNPNMQQLPAKGEWAKIRGIYTPDKGHKLITCDYSQLEVVIAAHFSQDRNLLKIVLEGANQHDITAQGLGVPRQVAKIINFAMQYGATKYKIRQIMNCSEQAAEGVLNKYWETYAGLKKTVDQCHRAVDAGQPIVNPFGRRRRFPTEFEKPWHKDAAKRQAFSSLVQGTGADITSRAFYRTSIDFRRRQIGRGLFTIHDELVTQAKDGRTEEAQEMIQHHMIDVGKEIKLTLPLAVDCSQPLERWVK